MPYLDVYKLKGNTINYNYSVSNLFQIEKFNKQHFIPLQHGNFRYSCNVIVNFMVTFLPAHDVMPTDSRQRFPPSI